MQMSEIFEEKCDCLEIHAGRIDEAAKKMPSDDTLNDMAELFKTFGDQTRIRILYMLFETELCVCDLAASLNMTQSAISHQLKVLRQSKLVKSRREGKSIFYSLADDHVYTMIAQGFEHVTED